MLEIFIVLNEKDQETCQVEGSANNSKVKKGERGRRKTHFFFEKRINAWVASQEALV